MKVNLSIIKKIKFFVKNNYNDKDFYKFLCISYNYCSASHKSEISVKRIKRGEKRKKPPIADISIPP